METLWSLTGPMKDWIRPVDKKENYIKRCVAIPGDTISVERGVVHINGVAEDVPPMRQFQLYWSEKTPWVELGNKFLKEQDITDYELDGDSTIWT